jgi:hypothetical protein
VIVIVGFMYVRHLANQGHPLATEEKASAQMVNDGAATDSGTPVHSSGSAGGAALQPSGMPAPEGSETGTAAVEEKVDTTPVAVVVVEEAVVSAPTPETGEVVLEKRVEAAVADVVPEVSETATADVAGAETPLPESTPLAEFVSPPEAAPETQPVPVAEAAVQQQAPAVPAPQRQVAVPAVVEQPIEMSQPVVPGPSPGTPAARTEASSDRAASARMGRKPYRMRDTAPAFERGSAPAQPFPSMPGPFGPARQTVWGQRGGEAMDYAQPRQMPPRSYSRGPMNGYPSNYSNYYRGYRPRYPGAGYYPAQR